MTNQYPLHHTNAEPLYVQVLKEEYDRLLKVDREWKKLQDDFRDATQNSVEPIRLYKKTEC